MAGADRHQAASLAHRVEGGLVDEARRVPEDVARVGLHDERALADSDVGMGAQADQVGLEVAHLRPVAIAGQALERRPALSGRRDELALVGAHGAGVRRLVRGEMPAARGADPHHCRASSRTVRS
jgi:hypothetical protein